MGATTMRLGLVFWVAGVRTTEESSRPRVTDRAKEVTDVVKGQSGGQR
jgi:hypothetical protein